MYSIQYRYASLMPYNLIQLILINCIIKINNIKITNYILLKIISITHSLQIIFTYLKLTYSICKDKIIIFED